MKKIIGDTVYQLAHFPVSDILRKYLPVNLFFLRQTKEKWEGYTLRTAAAAKNNNVLLFREHVFFALSQQMPKDVTEPPETQWLIFFDSEHSWKNSRDPMRRKQQSKAECFPYLEWVAKKTKKPNEEQIEHLWMRVE